MKRILLAGFGGQGILFAGKFLAYLGLMREQEVSWLPSYGPEMRGGTANCSVILSDGRIGSPIVDTPDILICMNLPSLDKFEQSVVPGGQLYTDSALIPRETTREDIQAFAVPATQIASDHQMTKLANMILLGKVMRESGICTREEAEQVIKKLVPEKKQDLIAVNMQAIDLGFDCP
ncbi:MAG: 2-oxoacid:acceptor oxidoreductase family protein [Oscillospiraceae bacterium]|jgi:2-oxoglutarate ferredoxin oxidoreductase subunit gamma|nr:2-oxoacid:acceptor oxidoreductase family protein [Oscillospiraceae bacterium]